MTLRLWNSRSTYSAIWLLMPYITNLSTTETGQLFNQSIFQIYVRTKFLLGSGNSSKSKSLDSLTLKTDPYVLATSSDKLMLFQMNSLSLNEFRCLLNTI